MAEHLASIFGTEKDRVNCPFYFKIGACRHGDRCSRLHTKPSISPTLLLSNMYQRPDMITPGVDPQGQPLDPHKIQEHFEDFYEDLFEELGKYGEIESLNICDNLADHMVGNVYVQFREEEHAATALQNLTGRFYAGRPIIVDFSPVTDFREATCRQYEENVCNRGGYCNFMHLKKISRELRRQLFGRYRRRRSRSRSTSPRHRGGPGVERHGGHGYGRRDDDRGPRYQDRGRRPRSRSPGRRGRSRSPGGKRDRSPVRDRDNSAERRAKIEQWNREGSAERRAKIEQWNREKEEADAPTKDHSQERNDTYPDYNARNGADASLPDVCDVAVAKLNKAIVLYHLHDYSTAKKVLEPLFQNLEPIDEGTALHVCLLLLDLAVEIQDASKFADVICYMEKAFGVGHVINHADNGSMGHQSSDLVANSSSVASSTLSADDLNSDASANPNASEGSLLRTLSDETIEYETLFSRLDISGQNLSRSFNIPTSNDLARTPSVRSSSVDLKLKLPLFRVQLLFLTGNLKMAKRDLKPAMNFARGRDSSNALLLKSQLELSRENFAKAEKLLKASCNQVEVGSSIIYNNNAGCIFYQWGKHNTAGLLFNRALLSCSSLWKEKPRNIATISQDKSLFILYNSGLQYLTCGNPILAAQCFQKASLVFYNKPLLWLRLAECSLMALHKGLSKSFQQLLLGPEFKVSVLGQGKWRQLAVKDGLTWKGYDRCHVGSGRASNLSISFARQCLWNALHLVRHLEPKSGKSSLTMNTTPEESKHASSQANANGDTRDQKGGAAACSIPLYEDECRKEYLKVKQAILANLAFVELELGNPQVALSRAQSLLEIPECSNMYTFLARVYAAEALCLLNKLTEAAQVLSVYFSGGNNIDLPYSKEDFDDWQVNKPNDPESSNDTTAATNNPDLVFYTPEEAHGTLFVNLASMYAVQGEIEQAVHYSMQALSLIPNSREANLMAIYLDLKIGRVHEALSRLRRCKSVSFLSCASRSNGLS